MAKKKKSDDDEEGSRLDQLMASELFAKIKKQHGSSILTRASDYAVQKVPRIPTGVFSLDYALGGGWPGGRINVLFGHKSTGKTSLITRAIANVQKLCANCFTGMNADTGEVCSCGDYREPVTAYLDVEGTYDIEWAKTLGVDVSRLLLSVPDFAEQTLDIAEALVRSTEVDVLVIDSIAFLTPAKEIEESSGKELQAQQARTLGRGVRKFVSAMNYCGNKTGRRPTMFLTNQIRMKLGVMFGNPETQPGGFAAGFAATTEVKCTGGKYEMDETTKRPLYVDLDFKVEKNKSASAKIAGQYRLLLADTEARKKGDILDEPAMIEMAIQIGLVEKEGNGWAFLGEKIRSKELLETRLVTDPPFRSQFVGSLMQILTA